MVIYNTKEYDTQYMRQDDIVVEIHSIYNMDELLEKMRNGEEITSDMASIAAYATGDKKMISEAVPKDFNEESDRQNDKWSSSVVFDMEDLAELMDEYVDKKKVRDKRFQAFEAYIFNNPWRSMPFAPYEISKEELMDQLYAAMGIMPTVKDASNKSLAELRKMSNDGNRLYWQFAEVNNENPLPTIEDIEFYQSLNDYEKRIINDSCVNRHVLLESAKILKSQNKARIFTQEHERILSLDNRNPGLLMNLAESQFHFEDMKRTIFWKLGEHYQIQDLSMIQSKLLIDYLQYYILDTDKTDISNDDIRKTEQIKNYVTDEINKKIAHSSDYDMPYDKEYFLSCMENYFLVPQEELKDIYSKDIRDLQPELTQKIISYYESLYEKFVETYTDKKTNEYKYSGQTIPRDVFDKFIEKEYKTPMPSFILKAEEIFKEKFHGHAPRVLMKYVISQFLAYGWSTKDENLIKIADEFNQKNVQKVAKYDNLILFALSSKLNFNEIKEEQLIALATYMNPLKLYENIEKGFLDWFIAHKDTNVSELVDLIGYANQDKIQRYDINMSAKDLILHVEQAKGIRDCKAMEEEYSYKFSDNEIAIRGRNIVAQDGKMKMYMLPKDDYRNFTVGYDTSCCQHYGNAGETCVYKLTSDPFAACVVIERDHKILAQGFVWTDESQDTLVFDNVEFADDRSVGQFNSLFAAWCKAMPYKNIHVGVGYNQGMHSWGKKVTYQAKLPTTLSDGHCYSDYHTDARSLKMDGKMQISEKVPVRVTEKPDEPTRWDVLTNPDTAFLLDDTTTNIAQKLEFAHEFLTNQTPEIQMKAIEMSPIAIKSIQNPTEDVQKYIAHNHREYVQYIAHPCSEVQEILVELDPSYIINIANPTEAMCIKAVKENGLLLKDIQNPTEKVIKEAVKQNGYAIKFVENISEELQMFAVETTPKVVTVINNPSRNAIKKALDIDPHIIELLDSPDNELQMYAIEKCPSTINEIKAPCYEAVKAAIEANGSLIRNFQYAYPHLKEAAIRQNPFAIRAISHPTDAEYLLAVQGNRNVLNFVRDLELKSNLEMALGNPNTVTIGEDGMFVRNEREQEEEREI